MQFRNSMVLARSAGRVEGQGGRGQGTKGAGVYTRSLGFLSFGLLHLGESETIRRTVIANDAWKENERRVAVGRERDRILRFDRVLERLRAREWERSPGVPRAK